MFITSVWSRTLRWITFGLHYDSWGGSGDGGVNVDDGAEDDIGEENYYGASI